MNSTAYALIVDDHPMLGRAVAEFIKAQGLLDAVRNVCESESALDVISQYGSPTLAVVDFWLAAGASVDLLQHLRVHSPSTAILVISGDASAKVQEKARICGARGFMDKQASPEIFKQAIMAILGGLTWFHTASPDAASKRPASHDLPVTPGELGLSQRQGQILALVLQGLSNKRIALTLSVAESTVKEHITSILHKLSVSNRVEAITKLRGIRLVVQ